jgi:hypothetical protein
MRGMKGIRKPVRSVREHSPSTAQTTQHKLFRAVCRNPRCGHEWNARTPDPLKCSHCQTLRPEVWEYQLAPLLAEAV